MAKAKKTAFGIERRPDDVLVMACSFLTYRDAKVRTGETVYMTRADALDYRALHMIHPLEELEVS